MNKGKKRAFTITELVNCNCGSSYSCCSVDSYIQQCDQES